MRKTLLSLLILVALVSAACGDSKDKKAAGPTGAQSYVVDVDAAAPPQFQVSTYFPAALTVHPGDTIEFAAKSVGYPHTVSLGIKADQSNRPNPETASALVFGPCFQDADLAPGAAACATPANPAAAPAYAGKGFWSSGLMANGDPTAAKSIKLKLSDTIADGTYNYLCLLHAFMGGVIKVAKDGDRSTPTAVRADADAQAAKAIADAGALKAPAAVAGTVTAGYGDRITAVQLFDPATTSVKAGDTVTWKNASPYEPHVVTFKSAFKGPDDLRVTGPLGDKSGAAYTGGFTNSGFFGAAPFFPVAEFSLKFPKEGSYDYVCAIHPGMQGTVKVT
jgi:plastocyanin